MKVYFVEDNSDNNDDADDSAALSSEHHQRQKQTLHQSQHQQQQSGAHAFCANCGVHILRAPDQSSELLEVNANCIEDGGTQRKIKLVFRNDSSFASSTSSVTNDNLEQDREGPTLRSSASTVAHNIETVAENEPLCLGSNNYHSSSSSEFHHAFWESLDDERRKINNANNIPRKESISSSTSHTHPESYTATNDYDSEQDLTTPCVYTQSIAESDDYSMGSSSITASLGGGARSTSGLSHYSNTNINHRAGMLPPLSSRMQTSLSSDRSVKTLPPRWSGENCSEAIQQQRTISIGHSGEYATTRHGGIMSGANSVGAGFNMDWSVASMESNDLDLAGGGGDMGHNKMTVSPRMRDQMKRYMSRHMGGEQK